MSDPPVSVVVLTLDAGPLFETVIEELRSQDLDPTPELVAIDSGSSDGTELSSAWV